MSEEDTQKIWEKGTKISGTDPKKYRKDTCGAWIQRDKHGDREHIFGWEKHHPNGTTDQKKRIPLQWKNNLETGDGPLKCPVKADGLKNVEK